MQDFTDNLEELIRQHPILDAQVAHGIAEKFPHFQHAYTGDQPDQLALKTGCAADDSRIIAFLPLNSSGEARRALAEAFSSLVAGKGDDLVIDLDLDNPHTALLGEDPAEGLSDHFLYGVSADKLLVTSKSNPRLKIIGAGTYTPRAGDIYVGAGWDKLLEWAGGQTDGRVILLGPSLDRFSELPFLAFTEQIVLLAPALDEESQQTLAEVLQQVSNSAGESTGIALLWTEAKEAPVAEKTPAEAESAEIEEPAEVQLEAPAGEEASGLEPALESEEPAQQKAAVEKEIAAEELSLPETEGAPAQAATETPAETKAPGSGEDELGLPELEPLEEGLIDIREPGVPVKSPAAEAAGASAEADSEEEEIFLPNELLFLDEEESRTEDVSGKSGVDTLPNLRHVAELEPAESEAEESAAPREKPTAEKKLEPVELTLGEKDSLEIELLEAKAAPGAAQPEEAYTEQETIEAETVQADGEQEDAEALFVQEEEEDRVAAAAGAEEPGEEEIGEVDEAALEQMKSYEQALEASVDQEVELVLDTDPLGSAEETEAGEELPEAAEEEAAEAGEALVVEETVSEAAEEAAAEEIEELAEEEIEVLDLEDLEPLEEEVPEAAEQAAGAKEMAAPEEEPAATEKPAAVEETAETAVEEAVEEEAVELEEVPEAAAEAAALAEETGEPAMAGAAEAAGEAAVEGLAEPSDEEIDNLLSGATALDEIGGEVSLEEAVEEKPAARRAAKPARKKKKSPARALVTLVVLAALAGGMFFIWQQGTVSSLVRQVPALQGIAKYIPGMVVEEQAAKVQASAADSLRQAQMAQEPPPPLYDKFDYSIQLGSFRYLPQAIKARDALTGSGFGEVYVVPLELDSLGTWNRLYIGMYHTQEQCDTALVAMQNSMRRAGATVKLHGEAISRRTPLTLKLGESASLASFDSLRTRLEKNNITTYLVKLSADSTAAPVYRLYSGAFEYKEQAIHLRNQIFNLGIRAEIIEREG